MRHCYPANELERYDGPLGCCVEGWEKEQRISLREAAKQQAPWNKFTENSCKCTTGCSTKKCRCLRNGLCCSSHCHGGRSCSNKKYDEPRQKGEKRKNGEQVTSSQKEPKNIGLSHLGLEAADEEILKGPGWLNDRIVNAAQSLLRKQYPHVPGIVLCVSMCVSVHVHDKACMHVYNVNSMFIVGLQCTLLGQRLAFQVQPSESVQILHTGEAHWICISTIGCEDGQVNILDSLYTALPSKATEQVAALLHSKVPSLEVLYLDVAEQSGGNDCGCFAIAFAEALCRGEDPSVLNFDQAKMRPHLLSCLEEGTLTPFPAGQRATQGVKKTARIPIYCHCRQPEPKPNPSKTCTRFYAL